MKKRMLVFGAVLTAFFAALTGWLYHLATSDTIGSAASSQSRSTILVARARGTLYDRYLRPLVNQDRENRYAVFPDNQTVAALSSALSATESEDLTRRFLTGKPFTVTIDRLLPLTTGVQAFSVPVRYRVDSAFAVHLIGTLDSTGTHGVSGAEWAFDERLAAAAGEAHVTYTVSGSGMRLTGTAAERVNTLSSTAAGVVLTVDRDIQTVAERVADAAVPTGAIVVMDPYSGEILAMVSRPGFTRDTLGAILEREDAPLVNRALANYNCGSVFKIVSAAAALDAGLSADTSFSCTGAVNVGGVTFRCHHRLGHGTLNMFGGFSQSCNPYFIRLIEQTGADALYDTAQAFGFSRAFAIAPGWQTAEANLPSRDALVSPAALANLSFGQGDLLATPVHIAAAVSAVVNYGRLSPPTVLKGYADADRTTTAASHAPKQIACSPLTAVTLKKMMIDVVENGLGGAAKPKGGTAGGKTGTAQTGAVGQNGEEKVQSWFAGFFPAVQPQYVAVVVSEDAQSTGCYASAAFRSLAEEVMKLSGEVR